MALNVSQAEKILRSKFGEPAKPPTDYVVGFKTPEGKVLAIHREAAETRIWFQPPAPPTVDGVRLLDNASNGNSNINGPLLPLRAPTTLRVEIDSSRERPPPSPKDRRADRSTRPDEVSRQGL